jgi:hypothetical protein
MTGLEEHGGDEGLLMRLGCDSWTIDQGQILAIWFAVFAIYCIDFVRVLVARRASLRDEA